MNNPVNAEVVEATSSKLGEVWAVQWNDRFEIAVPYRSENTARTLFENCRRSRLHARLIRIPAEGEEQPKREPATLDEVEQYAARGCGPTLYHYEKAWRAAERYHGIGANHGS